ncbi:MAG: type II toxin-antitoxin system MqsA family antitoxin [Deltaproteobacteria bacterium]|nr:type II toxin-antitoxin system MqsA family antitoxin [Deltaproteobacteria bacterium]
MRCAMCGKGTVRNGRVEMKRAIAGHVFVATVRGHKCGACGEDYFDDNDIERTDLVIARALVDEGIVSGEAFKFVRKAAGLRAADLAELLKVTKETVSRWETDRVPIDHAARALLATMLADREAGGTRTQDVLRALRAPKLLGKRVKLGFSEG